MFYIFDGREAFYQWDLNQKLIINDKTIAEVHFSNTESASALICEVYEADGLRVVDVPNILLQKDWTIKAYGFCSIDNCTKFSKSFTVISRKKPSDYVYTETEVKAWEDAEARINAAETRVNEACATVEQVTEQVNELQEKLKPRFVMQPEYTPALAFDDITVNYNGDFITEDMLMDSEDCCSYPIEGGSSMDITNNTFSNGIGINCNGVFYYLKQSETQFVAVPSTGFISVFVMPEIQSGGNGDDGSGGYSATIYMAHGRGAGVNMCSNDDEWQTDSYDYGIQVTKADGTTQYLTTNDFATDLDESISVSYGADCYPATIYNAVSVEFRGNGYIPEVQKYDAEMDSFDYIPETYYFGADNEKVTVYFS